MMNITPEHKDVIGTLNPDGTFKKWPTLNIQGGRYNKPATTQPISPEYFVVLPAGFIDWDVVKTLKEQYGGAEPAVVDNAGVIEPAPESFVGDGSFEDTSIKRSRR